MQHFFLRVADPLFLSHWNVTKFSVTLIKLSAHLLAFLWCQMYFYGASSSGFPSLRETLPASFLSLAACLSLVLVLSVAGTLLSSSLLSSYFLSP